MIGSSATNSYLKPSHRWATVGLAVLILVTGSQGHDPGNSETITAAAPESPGSTGVSEAPEVQVELESKDSGLTEESVSFVNTNSGVRFNGSMRAPTPCYTIDHRVQRPNTNRTIVNIQLERENGTQLCTQQIVSMSYKGFTADTAGTVEVRHDGETVGSFEARGDTREKSGRGTGLIRQMLSVLSGIIT